MPQKSFTLIRSLNAPPQIIFRLLTESKLIRKWSGQNGRVDSKPGGEITMFDGWVKGEILSLENGKKISFSWLPADWDSLHNSVVKISLSGTEQKTKVTLIHSGFPDDTEMNNHKAGWDDFYFEPLKQLIKAENDFKRIL